MSIVRAILAFVILLTLADGDPAKARNLPIVSGEYKLPARVDPLVTSQFKTELWARVWRPVAAGRYPLLVFMHGNHDTCSKYDVNKGIWIDDNSDYTYSGTCPVGYVTTKSHLGYSYLAVPLARLGYVVVSINTNLGINRALGASGDPNSILRRGRLVLRHLEQLADGPLAGRIDFGHVGLLGHSRGGEGMRAAVRLYKQPRSPWPRLIGPAVTFQALFEIGPTDFSPHDLSPVDLHWNVLLPGCDKDIPPEEHGSWVFNRALRIVNERKSVNKSTFVVYGANHNYYNSVWQTTDLFPQEHTCFNQTPLFNPTGGSEQQRQTAIGTVIPFFRAHVGAAANPKLAKLFDPSYPLPKALTDITVYSRGFTATPRATENFIIDNFEGDNGISSRGVPNQFSGLATYNHTSGLHPDPTQLHARIVWDRPRGRLQVNAAFATGPFFNVRAYRALEFRIVMSCKQDVAQDAYCRPPIGRNPNRTGDVDFSIALANGGGTVSSAVTLKSRAAVFRPPGLPRNVDQNFMSVYQTVRIPLSAFAGANLSRFRGVRFTFNRTPRGQVYIANLRLTRAPAGPGAPGTAGR